jgi:AP2 domain
LNYINLTQGKQAIVSDEDFETVSQFKWYYDNTTGYAKRDARIDGKRKCIYMHRFVNDTSNGELTDHINGNRLDNRRENLRSCNFTQNHANKKIESKFSSKYKGVYWQKNRNKWIAMIRIDRKGHYLGCYDDEKLAAKAYNEKAKEFFGEFARLNIIEEG